MPLLRGGAVADGKVVTDWPGLQQPQDDRDLKATIDKRQHFKHILQGHLGILLTRGR